jgi:lipopolysaccharide transport system ATP-binding protein
VSLPALSVSGIGKRYDLGSRRAAYTTLRDGIAARIREPLRSRPQANTIWALKDVSFEVERGEAVGVVGSNGAGKSTLLKILSEITEPTEGEAIIRGRVGCLLEVGTGFHPELSGRENIYMNGAILGMRRAEIRRKLDEIVAFAEVEKFLDTPVKRYSSGMYVRLAFSVAAHLETDILLVDEVLSVGDLAFQRKCLGRMRDQTSQEGRTVIFVSHNLASIRALTTRCAWLEHGGLREIGLTEDIARSYVAAHSSETGSGAVELGDLSRHRDAGKNLAQKVSFESVELLDVEGRVTAAHLERNPITVRVVLRCREPIDEELEIFSRARTLDDTWVFAALGGRHHVKLERGLWATEFTMEPNLLRPGVYQLEFYCLTRIAQDHIPAAITFSIESNQLPTDDPRYGQGADLGLIRVSYPWTRLEPAGDAPPS